MKKDLATTLKLAGILIALFLAYLFRGALVQPPPVDADHAFNTERAYARLARILGDETPHPVDSDANDGVIARIIKEIEALGFDPMIRDQFHCVESWRSQRCARLQNIAFWVTEPGPNAVLLLSHHDSVPAGPGASDDGAGVSASLEIASLLKDEPLSRPLLVLMTDGEELALMGANLFVEDDPLAQMVGAVINMEARGVRGLSAFFQTSRPNTRDLKILSGRTRLPLANSMSADIYELMPNDTDMTEFLPLPIDATNLAYTDGVAFYHTPGDNLENMDKRALFHLGASALAAAETFLNQTGQEPETQVLYIDILGQFIVTLTPSVTLIILLLSGLLALLLLWKFRADTALWRVTLVPLLALALGGGLAVATSMIVNFIRPEQLFGSAYPIALRALHASAGLTGALIIYTFMTRPGEAKPLLASAWLWTSVLGLITFFTIQGGAILFALPLAFFIVSAVALWLGKDLLSYALSGLGALLFALIILPAGAVAESNLFIESAAPLAITLVLLFAYITPLVWPEETALLRSFWLSLVGAVSVTALSLIASIMVPAYSKDAPRALSIAHIQSANFDETVWSVSGPDPVPGDMLAAAPFEAGSLPVFGGPRQIAPAPTLDAQLTVNFVENTVVDGIRHVKIEVIGLDTDRFNLSWSPRTLTALSVNGVDADNPGTVRSVICSGRSCRKTALSMTFPVEEESLLLDILSYRFGLGPHGQALVSARPDWAIARQRGDLRLQHQRINLSGNQ